MLLILDQCTQSLSLLCLTTHRPALLLMQVCEGDAYMQYLLYNHNYLVAEFPPPSKKKLFEVGKHDKENRRFSRLSTVHDKDTYIMDSLCKIMTTNCDTK